MENLGEIIIYQTDDGLTKLDVKMENETVWLTQAQLVELYQSSKANVSEHIAHIFEEGELTKEAVVRKFRTTASDGKNYNVLYYNLDMIISLGYRINSATATRFRQWATQRLKEYIIKGFTIDDERLKGNGGGNYWNQYASLRLYRINCIMQPTAILPLKLFTKGQMQKNLLWD